MNIKPRGDLVVLKREKDPPMIGGIVIPDESSQRSMGVVQVVGPGRVLDNGAHHSIDLKHGDFVYFSDDNAREIQHGGETYLLVPESQIWAIHLR